MKPSLTIDERGILLHLTASDGRGLSVPMGPQTFAELSRLFLAARGALGTAKGRAAFAASLGRLLGELGDAPAAALRTEQGRSTLFVGLGRILTELAELGGSEGHGG